jgi:NADH-quinone oxidoreductase subunit C
MVDEPKDRPPNPDKESADQPEQPKTPISDPSKPGERVETIGADIPEKAQPLPPEAGSVSPADEIESKVKTTIPPGEKLKTEAKVEAALPGVEKPSKTPTLEGASEKGEPAVPVEGEPAKPKTGAQTARPAPPKAAPAPGQKPAPPAKKGPVITTDISGDPFIDRIKERFGDSITEAVATLNQQILRVKKAAYFELCRYLRDDEEFPFDMCTDLTATHWPERAGEEFDIVVMLYSVSQNRRLRIKTAIANDEAAPSVTSIWEGANWMEREAFDMFGIKFEGHPDLRRILLPEDWPGYPLRKEYPIEYRDNEWTDKHLQYREIDYDTDLIDVKYAQRR